jgi:DNA repair protein RecO (recombination protein O)
MDNMELKKTKGLITKEIAVGESDKILKVFTKDKGKISISAKGSRKHRSHLVAGTQLFVYSDFVIYHRQNYYAIQQLDIIESFYEMRDDLFKFSYAAYMLELLDALLPEEEPSESLFTLILKTLKILSKTTQNPKLITRIFELKAMAFSGFMPEILSCVHCGKPIQQPGSVSVHMGGILCPQCINIDLHANKISGNTRYTMQYILAADINKLFTFTVSNQILDELTQIMEHYISNHLEKRFKTLDFLKEIEQLS